jgi:hypoxanthine phosphoribosyltransferase
MKWIFLTAVVLLTFSCFAVDDHLELLISSDEIAARVGEVAVQINQEYKDKDLTLVMIMKGSLCIASDLIRQITVPCTLEYIRASSYGQNGTKPGELTISELDHKAIQGRDLLLIDDILETGNTMQRVIQQIRGKCPKSIKTLLLLVKDIPRITTIVPDFTLFHIQDRFVVGYGLDYKELYRGLPGIYAFINDTPPF